MNLKTRKPAVPKGMAGVVSATEKEQAAKDYYASVRTNVRVSTVVLHLQALAELITLGLVTLGIVKCMLVGSPSLFYLCFLCRVSCWLGS